jgi:hypothetical protein
MSSLRLAEKIGSNFDLEGIVRSESGAHDRGRHSKAAHPPRHHQHTVGLFLQQHPQEIN